VLGGDHAGDGLDDFSTTKHGASEEVSLGGVAFGGGGGDAEEIEGFSFNEDLGEVQDFSGVGNWALRKEGLSEGEANEREEAREGHEGAWWMQALRREAAPDPTKKKLRQVLKALIPPTKEQAAGAVNAAFHAAQGAAEDLGAFFMTEPFHGGEQEHLTEFLWQGGESALEFLHVAAPLGTGVRRGLGADGGGDLVLK
jgi:hypothetical protein